MQLVTVVTVLLLPGKASGPDACIRLVRIDTGEASVRVTLNGFAAS